MISYTDCKNIECVSISTDKWKLFDAKQSKALCDMLDVKRNLLRPVEAGSRHGCPPQDLDKSRLYGVDYNVQNNYQKSTTRSKF